MAHKVFSEELGFTELLKESFLLIKKNIVPLLILNLLFNLPSIINSISNNVSEYQIALNPGIFFLTLITSLISLLGGISTLKVLNNSLFEEKNDYLNIIKFSFSRYIPYFITSLIYVIAIVVGTIAIVIPGIIFAMMFLFAGYVSVVRHYNNAIDAMKYSKAITKGKIWRTFLYVLSAGIMSVVIYLVFQIIFTLLFIGDMSGGFLSLLQQNSPALSIISNLMLILVGLFIATFNYLMMVNYEAEKGYFIEEGREG